MKTRFLISLLIAAVAYGYGLYSVKRDVFPYSQLTHFQNKFLVGGLLEDQQWHTLTDREFSIEGLPAYEGEGAYYRLPAEVRAATRKELRYLSKFPAGGRMRFRTDAQQIRIEAKLDGYQALTHMTAIMQYGFDIYVDNRYVNSVAPVGTGRISEVIRLSGGAEKEVTLYFPLYSELTSLQVRIPKASAASSTGLNDEQGLVVFYGSSITQGCCASNPAMAFPTIVARKMDFNLLNLGFVGNGMGDLDIAKYIAGLKARILILDFWANPTPELYATALPAFYREIRSQDPESLIFVLAPFSTPGRENLQAKKYASSKQFVEQAAQAGDRKIFFIEGLLMEDEHDAFVDGRHLNSYGNNLVAERLMSALGRHLNAVPADAGLQQPFSMPGTP